MVFSISLFSYYDSLPPFQKKNDFLIIPLFAIFEPITKGEISWMDKNAVISDIIIMETDINSDDVFHSFISLNFLSTF